MPLVFQLFSQMHQSLTVLYDATVLSKIFDKFEPSACRSLEEDYESTSTEKHVRSFPIAGYFNTARDVFCYSDVWVRAYG